MPNEELTLSTPTDSNISTTETVSSTPTESVTNLASIISSPTNEVNLSELQTKISEYESKLSTYEPDYQFLQQYGGRETAEPFFKVVDSLVAPKFDANQLAQQIHSIDKTRYNDFVWSSVDRHKDAIAEYILSDPKVVHSILGNNEEFQQFQEWKAAGGTSINTDSEDLKALEGLDPSDPLYSVVQNLKSRNSELNNLRKSIEAQKQAAARYQEEQAQLQREEKINNYISTQENWLDAQTKNLNWGDEFKDDIQNIKDIVQQRFMSDAEAKNALSLAAHYTAEDSPVMAKRYTQIVQNKLSHIFKSVVERENRKIQEIRQYRELTRKNQETRKDIPSGGGRENASLGSSEITGSTMEERIMQRIARGVQAGRVPNIFGSQ